MIYDMMTRNKNATAFNEKYHFGGYTKFKVIISSHN